LVASVVAGAGAENPVDLAPAPGARFPFPEELRTDAGTVKLDSRGRGRVERPAAPAGFRSYRFRGSNAEQIRYFPSGLSLLTWPLRARDAGSSRFPEEGELIIVAHGQSWSAADKFRVDLETAEPKARTLRLVLPLGRWDVAAVLPGWSPVFSLDVNTDGKDAILSASSLEAAANLKARIREKRSGGPPAHWSAFLQSLTPAIDPVRTRFFAQYPVGKDLLAVDFDSLPIAGWELRVDAPGFPPRSERIPPAKPGQTVDLGNLFLSGFGSLRVALSFPDRVPEGDLVVSLHRNSVEPLPQLLEIAAASRVVIPKETCSAEFQDLDPGPVTVRIRGEASGLRDERETSIREGETAEVPIELTPRKVRGIVSRASKPLADIEMTLARGTIKSSARSESDGQFSLVTWSAGHYLLMATAEAGQMGFAEPVTIPEDVRVFEHDVKLPSTGIAGTVRDAETRRLIANATVDLENNQAPDADKIHFMKRAKTDADGRYRFDYLSKESLQVSFKADGYSTSIRKDVWPSDDGTVVDADLSKGNALRGIVLDERGAPIPTATVGLDVDASGYSFLKETTTSTSGEFQLDGIPIGAHILVAHRCGYVLAILPVDAVSAETSQTQTLVLPAVREALTIHFEDPDGAPIERSAVGLAVNGVRLPLEYPSRFAVNCGGIVKSDGAGNLTFDLFPRGNLVAISLYTQQVLGSFVNDGSSPVWRIRVSRMTAFGVQGMKPGAGNR
jgi:hypothetical protein